jgi:hypothetical protein
VRVADGENPSVFWSELLVETNIVAQSRLGDLYKEATELLAIFAASQHTAKGR